MMRTKILLVCLLALHVCVARAQVNRDSVRHRIAALQDSLKRDANSISASVELARCYMAVDSLRQAENVLYHVQTVDMRDARVYIALGELYEKQHVTDMARAQYEIALKRDPNNASATAHLAALGEPVNAKPKEEEPGENDFVDIEEEPQAITPIEKLIVYPEDLKLAGTEGKVELDALIDKDGRVLKVNILKSTDPGFAQSATNAVMNTRFTPARRKGEPVKVWITRTIRFKLAQ
jgi:TonB family protein